MSHDAYNKKISLWIDDELPRLEVAELQAHLADCLLCQQHYQALKQVDAVLRGGAKVLVTPAPGFTARFETRLAQQQARSGGHIWLGFGVLLLGTMFLFIIGGLVLSTFISAGITWIDGGIFYRGLAEIIKSANLLGVWLNLATLLVKVSVLTMSQPLFWTYVLAALALTWLWVRLMKFINRPTRATVELLV